MVSYSWNTIHEEDRKHTVSYLTELIRVGRVWDAVLKQHPLQIMSHYRNITTNLSSAVSIVEMAPKIK